MDACVGVECSGRGRSFEPEKARRLRDYAVYLGREPHPQMRPLPPRRRGQRSPAATDGYRCRRPDGPQPVGPRHRRSWPRTGTHVVAKSPTTAHLCLASSGLRCVVRIGSTPLRPPSLPVSGAGRYLEVVGRRAEAFHLRRQQNVELRLVVADIDRPERAYSRSSSMTSDSESDAPRVESGARPSRARCGGPAGCTQARSSESMPGGSIDTGGTLALKTTRTRAERQPAAQRQAHDSEEFVSSTRAPGPDPDGLRTAGPIRACCP